MTDIKVDETGKIIHLEEFDNIERNTWTVEEEREVRRKMDWHVVPVLTIMYLLCFVDRTNIGNARIAGMGDDLQLQGYRFNWVQTPFYLAYAFVEIPSNIALKRFGAKVWLPTLTFLFGVICMGHAFARTFPQLIVLRILLGLAEGGMMPGTAFYLSCFYRREELLFRIGVFATSASLAGAFGGLMAAGLSKIPRWGAAGSQLHTWRNIFFFEGLVTILLSTFVSFLLPRHPGDCKFLTERQKAIAMERLAVEHKGEVEDRVTMRHIKQAIFNINNQFCAFGFLCANVAVQSISLFMPTILRDMGYASIKAQLYSVPPYVVACLVAIVVAFISDKQQQRGLYLVLFGTLAVIGYSILLTTVTAKSRYTGVFIVALGAFPNGPGFLSWGINNAGSAPVRAVTSAYIMTVGTMGAVIATWTYVEKDKPLYHVGNSMNLAFQAILVGIASCATFYCHYENRLREAGKRDYRLVGLSENEAHKLGYQHPSFRYMP